MMVEGRSYAKINWTLELLGQRADGYHEVRTILQTIALHDLLHFETTDGPIEIACDDPLVPGDERNLVYRAAALLRHLKGVQAGVRVKISKRIPVAGGLGGGSSNAAVAILALQRLWQVPLSPEELIELGAAVGSDVPFFFYGGTAVGVGRGSEVFPLPDVGAPHLLLVTPDIRISTTEVYAAAGDWPELTSKSLRGNIPDSCAAVFCACGPPVVTAGLFAWNEFLRNDLEPVVVNKHPVIRKVLERLRQLGGTGVRLSGSGATVFALFENSEAAEKAESELAGEAWQIVRTRTVGRKEYWDKLIQSR